MSDLIPAASALVMNKGKILLVRSTRTPELWAFPGGKAEQGESRNETAIREVREEVGLDIRLTKELGTYVTPSGFAIQCFVAETDNIDVKIDTTEIIEAGWFDLTQAFDLKLISTVREALEKFAANHTV